ELEPATTVDLKNYVRVKRRIEKILSPSSPIKFRLPEFRTKKVAIVPALAETAISIQHRTLEMFQNGWVGEVERLLNNSYQTTDPGFRAIGYRAIAESLSEPEDKDRLVAQIVLETVQYAKRQRTWLRAEPKLDVYNDISAMKGVLASI
ncbi:MAG TPA: tRNA dimethylallyltransferase, partial [Fimbriimonas sp.]|nr:tRNA dimethylallyltransferase [Fimbriimonas sp.]